MRNWLYLLPFLLFFGCGGANNDDTAPNANYQINFNILNFKIGYDTISYRLSFAESNQSVVEQNLEFLQSSHDAITMSEMIGIFKSSFISPNMSYDLNSLFLEFGRYIYLVGGVNNGFCSDGSLINSERFPILEKLPAVKEGNFNFTFFNMVPSCGEGSVTDITLNGSLVYSGALSYFEGTTIEVANIYDSYQVCYYFENGEHDCGEFFKLQSEQDYFLALTKDKNDVRSSNILLKYDLH